MSQYLLSKPQLQGEAEVVAKLEVEAGLEKHHQPEVKPEGLHLSLWLTQFMSMSSRLRTQFNLLQPQRVHRYYKIY